MIKLFLNTVFDWGKAKTVFVNEFFKFVFIAVFFFFSYWFYHICLFASNAYDMDLAKMQHL